jgi:predicted CXXCH cytochrome family protein
MMDTKKTKTINKGIAVLIGLLVIIGGVAFYQVFWASATVVDVLNGNGNFEVPPTVTVSQYNYWDQVSELNTTFESRYLDSPAVGSAHARIKVNGNSVSGRGYLQYNFTMPSGDRLDSTILSLKYKLTYSVSGFSLSPWNVYWKVYDASSSVLVNSGTVGNFGGISSSQTTWSNFTSSNITNLSVNTTYYLRIYAESTTHPYGVGCYTYTNLDDVQLNATTSADTTPPSTTMTDPATGTTQSGTINLKATATDDTIVERVYFEYADNVDFTGLTTVTGAVYDFVYHKWVKSWDTSSLNGIYYVRSRAYDGKGQNTASASVNYTMHNQGPAVDLTYFSDATFSHPLLTSGGVPVIVSGDVYIKITPNETLRSNTGDNQITIEAPGTLNDVSTPTDLTWTGSSWRYKWSVQEDTDGDAQVQIKATDTIGNIRVMSSPDSGGTVKIDNIAPTVSLTCYSDSSLFLPLPLVGGIPVAKAGTVYIKLTPNEQLRGNAGDNRITIDAPGVVNDVYNANVTFTGGNWVYAWMINKGNNGNTSSITVKATDSVGHTSSGPPDAGGEVTIDNIAPTVSLTCYSDAGLTQALAVSNGKPVTTAGHVWIKLVSSETLRETVGDNQITIDAPGTANDVSNVSFAKSGSDWIYDWTVTGTSAGENDGDTNLITIKGTDIVGNITSGSPSSGGTVTIDNTGPDMSLEYYSDINLTNRVPTSAGLPVIGSGFTYIKLVGNEALSTIAGDHKLSMDAPGAINDISNQDFTWDAAHSAWKYEWSVQSGNDGTVSLGSITVTAKNVVGITESGAPVSGGSLKVQAAIVPITLTMSTNKTYIASDGTDTAIVTANLIDQYGNPVVGQTVNFTTSLGTLLANSALTDASGNALVQLKSSIGGNATITATVSGFLTVSGTTTVSCGPIDTSPPILINAEATSKQIIWLTFDEQIKDLIGSTITVNQGVYTVGVLATLTDDTRVVKLVVYGDGLVTGNQNPSVSYTVYAQDIKDRADNIGSSSQNFDSFTPHGKYSPNAIVDPGNSTRMCGQCHLAHSSQGFKLWNRETITKVCFVCHGVTGISDFRVEGEFTSRFGNGSELSNTLHKSLDGDNSGYDVLYCSDCHNPHGNKIPGMGNDVYPKLLRATVGQSVYYTGNDFCFACHGETDKAFPGDVNYYVYNAGNHINTNAIHYNKDVQDGALSPISGTEVTCVRCHEKHGSQFARLLDNTRSISEEDQCYKCHGNDQNYGMTGVNVFTTIRDSVSKHRVEDTDYGRIECSSCHGPHSVGNAKFVADQVYSAISDPDNTKNTFISAGNTVRLSEFCLKCHDSTLPTATITATELVPYTVSFVDPGFTTNEGGWNKDAPYSYDASGHYNSTALRGATDAYGNYKNECTICHDWHGTSYKWLVRLDEDKSGIDGICLQCHNADGFAKPSSVTSLNVKQDLIRTSAHPTIKSGYSGKHSNTEDNFRDAQSSAAQRHAQCYDCHDPHTVRNTLDNVSDQVYKLGNISGVKFNWGTTTWSQWNNDTPTEVEVFLDPTTNNVQAYLCFKCHSKYAYGLETSNSDLRAPHDNPSNNGTAFKQTDVAREFSPNTKSKHIVIPGYPDTGASINVTNGYGSFTGSWASGNMTLTRNSVLKCTDCHASATGAQGPHGSTNAFILVGPWYPVDPDGGGALLRTGVAGTQTHLCFKCHSYAFYVTPGGGNSQFWLSSFLNFHTVAHPSGCAYCHGGLPHGWWRTNSVGHGWPLTLASDPAPYGTGSVLTALDTTKNEGGGVAWGMHVGCKNGSGCP